MAAEWKGSQTLQDSHSGFTLFLQSQAAEAVSELSGPLGALCCCCCSQAVGHDVLSHCAVELANSKREEGAVQPAHTVRECALPISRARTDSLSLAVLIERPAWHDGEHG